MEGDKGEGGGYVFRMPLVLASVTCLCRMDTNISSVRDQISAWILILSFIFTGQTALPVSPDWPLLHQVSFKIFYYLFLRHCNGQNQGKLDFLYFPCQHLSHFTGPERCKFLLVKQFFIIKTVSSLLMGSKLIAQACGYNFGCLQAWISHCNDCAPPKKIPIR